MLFARRHLGVATTVLSSAAILATSYTNTPLSACSSEESSKEMASAMEKKDDVLLKHVIIVMRHGDRAPVSKSIGPNYPQTKLIDEIWKTKLPTGSTEDILKCIAHAQSDGRDDSIYTGRDVGDHPYGQLTEIGANQLIKVGSHMRKVYVDDKKFLPDVMTEEIIYSR